MIAKLSSRLLTTYTRLTNTPFKLLIMNALFNIFNLICFIFYQDMESVFVYAFVSIRSIVYIYRDKIRSSKFSFMIPVISIILQIVLGLLFLKHNYQVVPIIISCFVCYYLWFWQDIYSLKFGNVAVESSWMLYGLFTNAYITSIIQLLVLILEILSIVKMKGINKNE